jgi:uncharacterized protein (UPF0261 family)
MATRPVAPGSAPGADTSTGHRAIRAEPGIALIGTLDTKGAEIAYVRDRLRALGARTVVVDSGILGEPEGCTPDVSRAEVARAGGHDL